MEIYNIVGDMSLSLGTGNLDEKSRLSDPGIHRMRKKFLGFEFGSNFTLSPHNEDDSGYHSMIVKNSILQTKYIYYMKKLH